MQRMLEVVLVSIFLVVIFVEPVRTSLNRMFRGNEVREERLIGTVTVYNPQVKDIQQTLSRLGFDTGALDGSMGEKTRLAIKLFQETKNLKASGWIDTETLGALRGQKEKLVLAAQQASGAQEAAQPEKAPDSISPADGPSCANTVSLKKTAVSEVYREAQRSDSVRPKQIQEAFKKAGFYKGRIDGKIGKRTTRAIKAFQKARGLKPDGVAGKKTWEALSAYFY